MITKEEAYKRINDLVVRFEEQLSSYKSINYNETLTRRDFIDPFFQALGWDLDNSQGYAEAYREVIHEDRVKIDKATKAPDYSFKLAGGKRLFFVEAKKPSVSIKDDITVAYQIRRYGWSAKLPVSIITDFEEFAVYDCTKKPVITDKSSVARIKYINYKQYLEEFEFLWDTFSKERVLKGSFDKFVLGTANKKGTATVDKEFLISLDNWRTYLATSISLKNKELDEEEINFVVQQTIDRIIFLRIAEDRSIETYGNLKSALNQGDYYQNLFTIFTEADQKYNSGLFDLKKDQISKAVKIENKVLKTVINQLYYPESPYEFSVLSVEILGSAYEQFLGKQIKIDKYHRASIEEKPEVRKAGGVYYTPQYVVEYIVKNTVGKMIEGKTPAEVAQMTICDPACGSGSFLIGAYQYLLDWHRAYYQQDIGASPDVSNLLDARGLAHVEEIKTMADARGLNIGASPNASNLMDARGLNIGASTNASNLLDARGLAHVGLKKNNKFLTPEGNLTTAEKKRILLNNIYGVDIDVNAVEVTKLSLLLKCMEGETEASIATQINMFKERVLPTLDNNIKDGNSLIQNSYLVNELEFEIDLKKTKPFDWNRKFTEIFQNGGFDIIIGNPPYSAKQSSENKYLTAFYKTVEYKCDLFAFFIERGIQLLKKKGRLGYIIPVSWMTNIYYKKLREYLIESKSLEEINLIDGLVFDSANIDTNIIILSKENVGNANLKWINSFAGNLNTNYVERSFSQFKKEEGYSISSEADNSWYVLKEKLDKQSIELGKISKISLGMKLRSNDEFIVREKSISNPDSIVFGKDISKYKPIVPTRFFNFSKAVIVGGTKNPMVQEAKTKIFIQSIRNLSLKDRIVATFDENGYYFIGTVNSVILNDNSYDPKLILGLLNSNLFNTYFKKRFTTISLTASFIGVLPVIKLEEEPKKEIAKKITMNVTQLLKLNEQLLNSKLQTTLEQIQNRIVYLLSVIDALVYQLYDLTEEEIKIVEGE